MIGRMGGGGLVGFDYLFGGKRTGGFIMSEVVADVDVDVLVRVHPLRLL